MSPYEFVKYQYELNPTSAATMYLKNGKTIDSYKDATGVNWQDRMLQTAAMHNHSVSLSGGTDKTRYAVSGSLLDQDGILLNSGFRRYQGRIVFDQTVTFYPAS